MKIFCLLALSLLSVCYAKQVCYGDLGCFIDTQPFSGVPARPLGNYLDENQKNIIDSLCMVSMIKEKSLLIF